jgi:hypothetical protein
MSHEKAGFGPPFSLDGYWLIDADVSPVSFEA